MCKYIPLGSIVLLKGGAQKLVIIARGLKVNHNEEEYFFDYGAVSYPEGLIGDQLYYFDHQNISKVVFEGYSDVDDENVVANINQYLNDNKDVLRADLKEWK